MARKGKVSEKQAKAFLDLLERIENELPSGHFIIVSDGDGGEEEVELQEFAGIEVSTVEVVIDMALSEFQNDRILPKRKKGLYSLSGAFEVVFGPDTPLSDLAVDLETALSGYQDMIWEDDVELAQSLIDDIREEIKNAAHKA
jgi:hypothetical protein